MAVVLSAAGGLALFLFSMKLMTDGLKMFGGSALKHLLETWTSNSVKGVSSGLLITAFVQSSSAVTVATIGFVNAGILSLRQALAVVFGANVGTTITGWLVSIVGFGFKIEAMALPILAVGVALHLISGRKRYQGLGAAITGLALFFLGLAILKESFSDIAAIFGATAFQVGVGGVVVSVAIGFAATLLTQSSSAALAIILTAASEGVIGLSAAAAAIIGANVGTTSTAFIAALNATQNAKRVAAGHIAFNAITGIIALSFLPGLLWLISTFGNNLGFASTPIASLALFHTVFNVLGVLVFLPFIGRLAAELEKRFRTEEDDISRPIFLDKTVAITPSLAIPAIESELGRLQALVIAQALTATKSGKLNPTRFAQRTESIEQLGDTIDEFATSLKMEQLNQETAADLPRLLRIGRYLQEAARLAIDAQELKERIKGTKDQLSSDQSAAAVDCMTTTLEQLAKEAASQTEIDSAIDHLERSYQQSKQSIYEAATGHRLTIAHVDELLDGLSRARRMVKQIRKAHQLANEKQTISALSPDPEFGDESPSDSLRKSNDSIAASSLT